MDHRYETYDGFKRISFTQNTFFLCSETIYIILLKNFQSRHGNKQHGKNSYNANSRTDISKNNKHDSLHIIAENKRIVDFKYNAQ